MQAMTSPDTLTPMRYATIHAADLAAIIRPVTADDRVECAAWFAETAGMSDAEFAAYARLPHTDAVALRRLFGEDGTR